MMIQAVLAGEYWVAFWMALTWAVSCRPGETLKLAVKHVVSPNKLCRHYSLLLSPSGPMDLCLPSKTGDMDENLLIDQPYLQWVGQILGRMKSHMQADQPLFLFDVAHAGQVFKNIAVAAGYQPLGVVHSYHIRHGAASTDALTGLRTMEEIAKRGRWRCLSSVRRYEQGGKLAQIFGQLSEVQQNEALRAEKQVGHVMTSRFSEFFHIRFGSEHDLSKGPLQRFILQLISSDRVAAVWFSGSVCGDCAPLQCAALDRGLTCLPGSGAVLRQSTPFTSTALTTARTEAGPFVSIRLVCLWPLVLRLQRWTWILDHR